MVASRYGRALGIAWSRGKTQMERVRHRVFSRMPQKRITYIQQSSIGPEIRKRTFCKTQSRPIKTDTKKNVLFGNEPEKVIKENKTQ
jgi:hypothetical protein